MKWEDNYPTYRLVAEDGEVLDYVEQNHYRGTYVVESTGKHYTTVALAKAAALTRATDVPTKGEQQ